MKAIYLTKKGASESAFEIRETEKPRPQADEVLIRVEAFGLNYADVMARNGLYREAPPLPSVIGYEVVGVIEKVGADMSEDWLGKRVVAFTRFGGYASYAVSKKFGFAEIGDMDADTALCIATQYVTAYYMANQMNNLHQEDRVLIHAGAGGVGGALIQLCKRKGCIVYATAGSDAKLQYMKDIGADFVVNYRSADYKKELKSILGKERLDVTFNPIAGSTFKKDFSLLGSGGRIVLFGGSERSGKKWGFLSTLNFVRKMGLVIPIATMMRSKSIIGVNMLKIGDNRPKMLKFCMDEVVQMVNDNSVKPHVGATFQAEDIAKAHDLLENRSSIGKITVHW